MGIGQKAETQKYHPHPQPPLKLRSEGEQKPRKQAPPSDVEGTSSKVKIT